MDTHSGQNGDQMPPDLDRELSETVVVQSLEVLPGVKRPGALSSIRKTRQELARVYRDSREGKISPVDLAKYAYALHTIGKLCEREALEQRLKDLEAMIEISYGEH